jgi:hypothetical protein
MKRLAEHSLVDRRRNEEIATQLQIPKNYKIYRQIQKKLNRAC